MSSTGSETPIEHVITVSELEYLDEIPPPLAGVQRLECEGAVRWRETIDPFDRSTGGAGRPRPG